MYIRPAPVLHLFALGAFLLGGNVAHTRAQEPAVTPVPQTEDEVEVVSMNGSITRAKCPHSCESRGIPREHCTEWRSRMYRDVCYVQDNRLESKAIPMGGQNEKE